MFFTKDFIKNRLDDYFEDNSNNKKNLEKKDKNLIDYQDLAAYDGKKLINKIYLLLLGRNPDKKGLSNNLKLLKKGYPKSSLIYLIGRSKESKKFRKKYKIKIKNYYKLFLKYYFFKLIEPILIIKPIKKFFEKLRFLYRYGKYQN